MTLPNMKTFTLAVMKPLVWSLKCLYDYQVKYMLQLVSKQDELLRNDQEQIAKLSTQVEELCKEIIGYQQEMQEIRKNSYTAEQVEQLTRRNQELNYIVGTMYSLIYSKLPDAELPSFEDTYIPGDPVLSEEELEIQWRTENNIEYEIELTPEQQLALQTYIDQYYVTHPRPEELTP